MGDFFLNGKASKYFGCKIRTRSHIWYNEKTSGMIYGSAPRGGQMFATLIKSATHSLHSKTKVGVLLSNVHRFGMVT